MGWFDVSSVRCFVRYPFFFVSPTVLVSICLMLCLALPCVVLPYVVLRWVAFCRSCLVEIAFDGWLFLMDGRWKSTHPTIVTFLRTFLRTPVSDSFLWS